MFTKSEKDNFLKSVESLKKYRRADLIDEAGRNLLELLYTDPLPNDYIFNKCLQNNTTFLIGRKGTGKSTIFLRIEQEIRKKDSYISCYLDVKTIYETSKSGFTDIEYLNSLMPRETLEKYLIERAFIQSVLTAIQSEISKKTDDLLHNILKKIIKTDADRVKEKLENLRKQIKNNELLEKIEIPAIQQVNISNQTKNENTTEKTTTPGNVEADLHLIAGVPAAKVHANFGISESQSQLKIFEIEKKFSEIFIKVFQIKQVIIEIEEILKILKINHMIILLDDFSEIDDTAIKTFVNVILAPLNNWSEEFIKFKVAAYPNRVYFGKIDTTKIDIINLDFYNLYSKIDRNQMEERAVDFTNRIISTRIKHFTNKSPEFFSMRLKWT